jgi:hypothetical protein
MGPRMSIGKQIGPPTMMITASRNAELLTDFTYCVK